MNESVSRHNTSTLWIMGLYLAGFLAPVMSLHTSSTLPLTNNPISTTQLGIAASFDFSAPSEWENYYQEHEDVLEWHSSIDFGQIAQFVPTSTTALDQQPHILLVGCGNSQLPGYLLEHCPHARLSLLDYSQTCLDQLQQVYGDKVVNYLCGDATKLHQICSTNQFDMILDKGLSDAIFCGEGWDGQIEQLFAGASQVLSNTNGRYLLISYKLPASTQDFLRQVGSQVGLQWEFDLPPVSTPRVGISLAVKQPSSEVTP